MSKSKAQLARDAVERLDAIKSLRGWLTPGTEVKTIIRHVSASGMSRSISCVIVTDGEANTVDGLISTAMGWAYDNRHGGVKVSGIGSDMGHELVYNLSWVLYPTGFDCLGERCPSNDHGNEPRQTFTHHDQGGYALRQSWL